MKKFLEIIKYLIFITVPLLYYGVGVQENIIMDIAWVFSFAQLTKDFIMKVLLKKKYCEIDLEKRDTPPTSNKKA